MPPRKSNVSVVSNGGDEGAEVASAKQSKDGMSVEDLSLPKSMIARLAKGVLPANTQIQKDALLALHKSTTVFVSYIASTSNEIATAGGKKTIQPQDVVAALKDCEFAGFLPRLEKELTKYNEIQCDKRNTYRRKVKEEKAAATKNDGDTTMEDDTINITNGSINGHANGKDGDDADRPVKKLKADDGSALAADGDDEDDDTFHDAQEGDQDDAAEESEDEAGEDEVDEDEMEDDGDGEPSAVVDPHEADLRDEALDDPGSDSD